MSGILAAKHDGFFGVDVREPQLVFPIGGSQRLHKAADHTPSRYRNAPSQRRAYSEIK